MCVAAAAAAAAADAVSVAVSVVFIVVVVVVVVVVGGTLMSTVASIDGDAPRIESDGHVAVGREGKDARWPCTGHKLAPLTQPHHTHCGTSVGERAESQ
jgi:hypothetical protein